jgi:succinyl-diaminopimelate desuccinylase
VQEGVRGEFVIIGECNSNFKVANKSKGRYTVTIKAKGKTSHSAYAWLGKNAIWRMYEILDPIIKAYPIAKMETHKTKVNITKIESDNKALNRIPDNCTAHLDIRYAPQDEDTIIAKIKSLLPPDAIIEADHNRPYHFVNPKSSYITALQKATKNVRGKEYPLRFAHATSDATYFAAVGCDAIEFGPLGDGAHQDNEWVDIQSLYDYYQILNNFLLQLDGIAVDTDSQPKASYDHPAFFERIKSLFARQ